MDIKNEIIQKISKLTDQVVLEYIYIIICDIEKDVNHQEDE
jgi:hypothetical protein